MRYSLLIIGFSIFLVGCAELSQEPFDLPELFNRNAPLPGGIDCFDSDAARGAMAQFTKGFVYVDGKVDYDYCYSSSLRELRCIFGTKRAVRIPCALGCRNGACIRAEEIDDPIVEIPHVKLGWCSDADGDDIYTASSASSSEKTMADVCKKRYANHTATVDACDAPGCSVSEVLCSPDLKLVTVESECEFGCEKGACGKE